MTKAMIGVKPRRLHDAVKNALIFHTSKIFKFWWGAFPYINRRNLKLVYFDHYEINSYLDKLEIN